MGDFLKENWVWIGAPIVVVIVAVALILITSEGASPFVYNL